MKKILLIIFVSVAIGEIVSILVDAQMLHQICKPLIMLTLGAYYVAGIDKEHRSTTLLLAILFSFLGDVLLMYEYRSDIYFMAGLGGFLISHLAYLFTYRQHKSEEGQNELNGIRRIRFAFPIVLAGTGMIVILYPAIGELKIPVVLYAFVLTLMVLNALFRYGHTSDKSFWMVLSGAILFMISDSILAVDKFLQPIESAAPLIMVTYIGAQFLIVRGLMHHRFDQTSIAT